MCIRDRCICVCKRVYVQNMRGCLHVYTLSNLSPSPSSSSSNFSVISSARATSVRRDVTLISDPDELLHSCLKPSDGFLTEDSAEREEEEDLLALNRNGRVEFHVTRLHNCVNNSLNN